MRKLALNRVMGDCHDLRGHLRTCKHVVNCIAASILRIAAGTSDLCTSVCVVLAQCGAAVQASASHTAAITRMATAAATSCSSALRERHACISTSVLLGTLSCNVHTR